LQAKRLASRDGTDGNPVADGGALGLDERILAIVVQVEPELFFVVILLCDRRATSPQRARDATDERVEEALEIEPRRRRASHLSAPLALTFKKNCLFI